MSGVLPEVYLVRHPSRTSCSPSRPGQETLQTELTVEPDPAPLIHPNLAEVYRRKVAAPHEALADKETSAEAFEAIRALISAIVLTPENGELKTDLQGDIAHILTLASESKKPAALSDGLIEQVKVVAGARNCLNLLLLVKGVEIGPAAS